MAQGVTITSGENVNVQAKGNNTSVAKAQFNIFRYKDPATGKFKDGSAGLTIGFVFASSDVKAKVDGAVTAAGAQAVYTVAPATQVNGATDVIQLNKHGLQTGDTVIYRPGKDGTAIGGLEDGKEYYVIVVDADHIMLTQGQPIDLDNGPVNAGAQHTLAKALTAEFALSGVNTTADTITLAGHGFTAGQKVTYAAYGDSPIDNDRWRGLLCSQPDGGYLPVGSVSRRTRD